MFSNPIDPEIVSAVVQWLKNVEKEALHLGSPLDSDQIVEALAVGVHHPDKIHIQIVSKLPEPDNSQFRALIKGMQMQVSKSIGLTAGYGILVSQPSKIVLLHEMVHVAQYEENGGIEGFIPLYINEILRSGYQNNKYEKEARLLRRSKPSKRDSTL